MFSTLHTCFGTGHRRRTFAEANPEQVKFSTTLDSGHTNDTLSALPIVQLYRNTATDCGTKAVSIEIFATNFGKVTCPPPLLLLLLMVTLTLMRSDIILDTTDEFTKLRTYPRSTCATVRIDISPDPSSDKYTVVCDPGIVTGTTTELFPS